MALERTRLAPDLEIARVVTGLWQVADQERGGATLDPEGAAEALEPYVDAGFTTFDMADHYGSAEVIAGALAARRPDIQRLTKWVPEPGPATRDDVVRAVHRSLDRLAADHVDLLQFHAWNYGDPSWLDCLFWLDELRAEGAVRHLGMTNCDAVHLDQAIRSGLPIVSNQVCFSLLDRRAAGAMTDVCHTHRVKLLCYGTLAGGFLSERWLGAEPPAIDESLTWSQMKYRRFIDVAGGWDRFQAVLAAASRVAERLGVSVANVACRYVLDHPAVGGIIIGARPGGRSHAHDNLRLFGFVLDPAAPEELEEAVEGLDPIPGDCGDEYRRPPFLTASGDLSHHVTTFPAPYATRTVGKATQVTTGTVWEEIAGFSRAVRKGDRVWISGTTATHGDRLIGGTDPAAQTHFIIDKLDGVLQSLGADLSSVVRTRIYIRNEEDWEAVSRAHGARFGEGSPSNTLVEASPIGDPYLVEIEAEADLS